MDCTQCGSISKYKCPTCRQPYCSVACCKQHKETPCSSPPSSQKLTNVSSHEAYEFTTDDTVPVEKLKLLENSQELKECLGNPHVREILQRLDQSPYPDELIKEYMQEPIFTELVNACLKVVQDPVNN